MWDNITGQQLLDLLPKLDIDIVGEEFVEKVCLNNIDNYFGLCIITTLRAKKNTEKILMNPERYDEKHTTYWLQTYAICRYEYRRFCNAYLNDNVIKVQ